MMTRPFLLALCFFVCMACANATRVDPMLWEELVLRCDFLGVVTCVTAGGNVARYRVEECWKGTASNTVLIAMAPNYWGQQYQVVLVGERYLVAGFRAEAPSQITSFTMSGTVPVWWRNIPADYRLPLFQGMSYLSEHPASPISLLHEEWPDLAAFHTAVREFLAAAPAEQELRLLHRASVKYLHPGWDGKLLETVQKATTVEAILSALLSACNAAPERVGHELISILRTGGREQTIAYLTALPGEQWPKLRLSRDELLTDLRERLAPPPANPPAPEQETSSTEQELTAFRTALKEQPINKWPYRAYPTLCRQDPALVASWLARWHNTNKDWQDAERPYQMASTFAVLCPTNRARYFRQLLSAPEPFVRVTGAVYLCFEDRNAGMTALKTLSVLEGDAGVWAALTRARRGDRTAVPRALQVFATPADTVSMRGNAHDILQARVMELLSNAAAQANIPLPTLPKLTGNESQQARTTTFYQCYLRWWKQHANRLAVSDPWMVYLEKQKID